MVTIPGRVGFGGGPIGGLYREVTAEQASAALEAAWCCGIRYFDTAPHYGAGLSERRIGEFLATRPRHEYVVSTKVGRLLVPSHDDAPDDPAFPDERGIRRVFDFSRDGVLRSLDSSLSRLGLDHVDIVYVHDPDAHWKSAVTEALPALMSLREEGVIGAVGVGMNQAEMVQRFVAEADLDVVLVAGRYTLLDQRAAEGLFPLCRERGVRVVVGGVFNSGILADPQAGSYYDYAPAPPEIRRRVAALAETCARWGVPLQAAALQFPLHHPAVDAIVVGVRSASEVRRDIELLAHPVPEECWTELAEISARLNGAP